MNNKLKGTLHILLVVAAIAVCGVIAYIGIGAGHRGSTENIRLGLDLAGGVSVTYEATKANPTAQEMADTIYKMQKRVENESSEVSVYQEGKNRVTIDVPDVDNPQEVLEKLGQAGSLEFKDPNGNVVIDGSDITTAEAVTQQDQTGSSENVVKLTLNGSGKKKFAKATAEFINQEISIVYDGKVISSPTVQSEITDGTAVISGSFTDISKAEELASTIRIGALPLELKNIRNNIVGAKLGLTSLNTSLVAGIIGLILVIIFMIVFYRIPGVASSIALLFYVVAMLIALNGLDVTLTLPGIAGIILSIGMAVDANVIIFTRVKEELATGKTVHSAIKSGFEKALSAIIDGNITTLIAAVVLYLMGSGTVKGFAQTLGLGIVLSMFTALVVTKFILTAFCNLGLDKASMYGIHKERKTINFVGNFKKYLCISGALFLLCIGGLIFNKMQTGEILNYSLDFQGGTSTSVTFDEGVNLDTEKKQEVVDLVKETVNAIAEISDVADENKLIIRTTELSLEEQKALSQALETKYSVTQDKVETESISATVSNEMKSDAVIAVIIAAVFMLIYIWIRFKNIAFGASSVIALLHDVIVVLMVYAVFSQFITVGGTFIACMLTIVGYSINATIVIFDRIRENRKKAGSRKELAEIVNESVTQTLSRSINTSLTTFIMVFMLAILGVDAVRQFAIPLIVGIVCGAYSSVCLAGTMWYFMNKSFKKKSKK